MPQRYKSTFNYLSCFLRLIRFNLKSITRSPGSRDEKHFENFLTSFTQLEPHEQNSFDLFRGSWSTKIFDVQDTGGFDGFNDERINWLLDELGGVQSKKFWSSDHWKELTHICSREPAEMFFQ